MLLLDYFFVEIIILTFITYKNFQVETLINEQFSNSSKIERKKLKRERQKEAARLKKAAKEINSSDIDNEDEDIDLNTFLKEVIIRL